MMRRRYELSLRDGGGYVARRYILDAEALGCAVRLETDAATSKGLLLVLVGELLRAVAADGRERRNERQ